MLTAFLPGFRSHKLGGLCGAGMARNRASRPRITPGEGFWWPRSGLSLARDSRSR